MGWIRNLLAIIGLVVVLGGGYGYLQVAPMVSKFDDKFIDVYMAFMGKMLTIGDPGNAMVYSVPVQQDLNVEDVKESLKSLASARNFLYVGEAPFYKQVESLTGEPYRHISFLSFCDAMVGKMMADYNDVYTAFMPCRISVVEDKTGKLWLHTMALDLMIHGGKELPPDLKREAIRVWGVIQEIMVGAAAGEF